MKTAKEVIEQYELFKHETDELDETHIYLDNAIEAMEEFSSLKNRSLVEENQRMKELLHRIESHARDFRDSKGAINHVAFIEGMIIQNRESALSYKEGKDA